MTLVPSREFTAKIFDASMMLGRVIHRHIIRATHFYDLGIHERRDLTGFNWSSIPVVLLELGYLTNPADEALLVNKLFKERIAVAITDGIVELGKDLEL
jgi:N-acetylmuramoyl-L-alanine amidase